MQSLNIKSFFLLLIFALPLAACSSSAGYSPSYAPQNEVYNATTYGDVAAESDKVQVDASRSAVASTGGSTSAKRAMNSLSKRKTVDTRKFIRRASLIVEVDDEDDFKPKLIVAKKIAKEAEGYIQRESTVSLTMLVPTEKLTAVLNKLEKLGKVTKRNISIVDVTSRYVDMKIRIKNLKKMRKRLTDLVAQSTDVSEILKIERELNRVTTELERMEGRMRLLRRDTTYATIDLGLVEKVTPGPIGWIFYGLAVGVKWLFIWD